MLVIGVSLQQQRGISIHEDPMFMISLRSQNHCCRSSYNVKHYSIRRTVPIARLLSVVAHRLGASRVWRGDMRC